MVLYLGLDVGGTHQSGGLVRKTGELVAHVQRATPRAGSAQAGLAQLLAIAEHLLTHARESGCRIAAVGVGFGGPVLFPDGVVYQSHHVGGWQRVPLRARLEQVLELPVVVDNDCNAGALGEWRFGAGRGVEDLLYVNIGTGIGGGIISQGRLLRGVANLTGEIGHLVLDPDGPVCCCGNRGCLEAYCSGPSLARRARERVARTAYPVALTTQATSEDLFAAAVAGDALANALLDETAAYLAQAIGGAVVLLNSARVILGGGVGAAAGPLLAPLRRQLVRFALPAHVESLDLCCATLGYNAGVIGAAALAMDFASDA